MSSSRRDGENAIKCSECASRGHPNCFNAATWHVCYRGHKKWQESQTDKKANELQEILRRLHECL